MQISLAFWPSESCGTPSSQPLMTRPTLQGKEARSTCQPPREHCPEGRAVGRQRSRGSAPDRGDERLAAVARRVELGAVLLEGADVVLSVRSETLARGSLFTKHTRQDDFLTMWTVSEEDDHE